MCVVQEGEFIDVFLLPFDGLYDALLVGTRPYLTFQQSVSTAVSHAQRRFPILLFTHATPTRSLPIGFLWGSDEWQRDLLDE